MSKAKKYMFVVGCPRSGTTALGNLLSTHEQIFLGIERYVHRSFPENFSMTPELYELERFKTFEPGDTFYDTFDFAPIAYRDLDESHARATYFGDKIPTLYRSLGQLFNAFGPETRVIFIFRNVLDVAASYAARAQDKGDLEWKSDKGVASALDDWRAAIAAYKFASERGRILPVVYEDLFRNAQGLDPILNFLELDPSEALTHTFVNMRTRHDELEGQRNRNLSSEDMLKIALEAPFGGYRDIVSEARTLLGDADERSLSV